MALALTAVVPVAVVAVVFLRFFLLCAQEDEVVNVQGFDDEGTDDAGVMCAHGDDAFDRIARALGGKVMVRARVLWPCVCLCGCASRLCQRRHICGLRMHVLTPLEPRRRSQMPLIAKLTATMLGSGDWRARRAACIVLSLVSDGCGSHMLANAPRIVDAVLPLFADPDPRVRYFVRAHGCGACSVMWMREKSCRTRCSGGGGGVEGEVALTS